MKPFRSPEEMLDTHERVFGEAGRQCAEIVLRWAGTLFAQPLDASVSCSRRSNSVPTTGMPGVIG